LLFFSGDNITKGFLRGRLEPKRKMSESGSENAASNNPDSVVSLTDDAVDRWQPNHRQRELLQLTWSDDFEYLYNLGTHIYIYIFDHAPQARYLFPAFIVHGDAWKESKEFRSQALKFVQILSHAVHNIHYMERLQPILYNVGRAHVRFAERGFRPGYWNVVHSAIKSALAGHIAALSTLTKQDRAEAVDVWHLLSDYIVRQMRRGYIDGLAGNATGSSP
jgi:hypothetical protein